MYVCLFSQILKANPNVKMSDHIYLPLRAGDPAMWCVMVMACWVEEALHLFKFWLIMLDLQFMEIHWRRTDCGIPIKWWNMEQRSVSALMISHLMCLRKVLLSWDGSLSETQTHEQSRDQQLVSSHDDRKPIIISVPLIGFCVFTVTCDIIRLGASRRKEELFWWAAIVY